MSINFNHWFIAFAGFAALIVLHELGHFAAAKAVGFQHHLVKPADISQLMEILERR